MDERPWAGQYRRSNASTRPGSALSTHSPAASSRTLMPPPAPLPSSTFSSMREYTGASSSMSLRNDAHYGTATTSHAQTMAKPRASTMSASSSAQGRQGSSSTSRARRLHDLVAATVPQTRARRSDASDKGSRAVQEREANRSHLVQLAEKVLDDYNAQQIPRSSRAEERLVSSLKRKVRTSNSGDSSNAAIHIETTLSKIKRQPSNGIELAALLELMDHLAFSSRAKANGERAFSSSLFGLSDQSLRLHSRPDSGSNEQGESLGLQTTLLHRPNSRAAEERSPLLDKVNSPLPSINGDAHIQASSKASPPVSRVHEQDDKMQRESSLSKDFLNQNIPRAALLQRWREEHNQHLVPEQDLLQDVLYLLQGISGRYVGFEEDVLLPSNEVGESHDAERIVKVVFYGDAAKTIITPNQHLIHRIAELGRLYKRVDAFLTEQSQYEGSGLIMQSLCHFLSSEMTDYYRLVAILEAKMKQRGASNGHETQSEIEASASSLTLKRLAVWTEDVLLRMRLTSTIIESCKDAHGGGMVSLIHSYTFHGDPLIRKFTAKILDHVSRPFFHTLTKWIFEGELQDPFGEFFVALSDEHGAGMNSFDESSHNAAVYYSSSQQEQTTTSEPSSLWQHKFRFRSEMLPSFLDESFGRKTFSTGKSLHFIRFSCGDSDWVAARSTMQSTEGINALRYTDLAGFEKTIDEAYTVASSRLLDIFLGKFKLLEHLCALKEYLMLARGDFADLLMESMGPSLNRPAASLFRHNLTASLETAIRGSNSQFDDPDIVGRLDARILDFSEGDTGWDSFTLEYRVDEPVNTVLDSHSMLGYQVIFGHLWKVKRVDLALGSSWEGLLLAANTLRRVLPKRYTRRPGRLGRSSAMSAMQPVDDGPHGNRALVALTTEVLGQLKEHVHFVKQMQGFINLEVIEYSWNDLIQLFASHADGRRRLDLDSLIQSHRAYLNTLLAKVLLRSSSSVREKRAGESADHLALEVKKNLDTMLLFAQATDGLAAYVTDHAARYTLQQEGVEEDEEANNARHQELEALRNRLAQHHEAFARSTLYILGKLEKHSSLVVRDLATRVNFNSFYHAHPSSASVGGRRTPAPSAAAA